MSHALVLLPSLRMGGLEAQSLQDCADLLDSGCTVSLVTIFRGDGDRHARTLEGLRQRGMSCHALLEQVGSSRPHGARRLAFGMARAVSRLKHLVDTERPEIVYARAGFATWVARATARVARHHPRLALDRSPPPPLLMGARLSRWYALLEPRPGAVSPDLDLGALPR